MNVLVLGATGATGKWVVKDLLANKHNVTALVRNTNALNPQDRLTQIEGTALDIDSSELKQLISKVDAVISCLGHNLTFKGMFGAPRMLVRDSIQRIVAHTSTDRVKPLKLVLMSSSGVRNLDQAEPISLAQHLVLGLLRVMIPPHLDNERAAYFLRTKCKALRHLEWITVRPDSLVDNDQVTEYELHPAPIRSALFDAGKVSRVNVANCMLRLLGEDDLWNGWKGKMPVIYNK